MAIEQYTAAEEVVQDTLKQCRALLRRFDNSLLDADLVESLVNELVVRLLAAVDDALTSAPDPRDDTAGLAAQVRAALSDVVGMLDDRPGLPRSISTTLLGAVRFVESRLERADEVIGLVANVISWEQATPALAPLRVRREALQTLDAAARLNLQGGFLTRMVRAGMRALGPRWAVNLAQHYLSGRLADRGYWTLLVDAMDELSAWAAATDLHGIPPEFATRAVTALIEIAGHPELTEWAVIRIPLHRLSMSDLRELAQLLADRYAVMPIDWVGEAEADGTRAIEVAYLRALERTSTSWPGSPERALR